MTRTLSQGMGWGIGRGLGWHPDVPDLRDWTGSHSRVVKLLHRVERRGREEDEGRGAVDLREYFPPVKDQEELNSSVAHACLGLIEYFSRRASGEALEPSRLFLYQVTKKLLRLSGNPPVTMRATLKAMTTFGVPPERLHPYDAARLDDALEAHLFSFERPYRKLRYVRLDAPGGDGKRTLDAVKSHLDAGIPAAFGFSVLTSISNDGDIPYRPRFDSVRGGQAVVAVGYDDRRPGPTRGALLIRNSWGGEWGEEGYGWLPYAYVENGLAGDFWTVLRLDWLRRGGIRRPSLPVVSKPAE